MSEDERVDLRGGFRISAKTLELALRLEAAGVLLQDGGGDVLNVKAPAGQRLNEADTRAVRASKMGLLLLVRYCAAGSWR